MPLAAATALQDNIEPVDVPADGRAYIERARALVPMLAAAAPEAEKRCEMVPEVVSAYVAQGFYKMLLPRSLGGAELYLPTYVQTLETLAQGDASSAWILGQGSGCSMAAPYLDPGIAREVFGGPRGILAWGPPAASEAHIVPGGYRVTGSWMFGTGGRHASWLGAHVPVFEADGSPRRRPDGRPFIRTMIFPREQARIIDNWQVVGLRATGSDGYAVTDLFVPVERTLSRDNAAERHETGTLYKFSSGMIYACGFSGICLGIGRAMLDAFISTARDKTPRGAKRTLRDNNVIQSQVAQAEAQLLSSRMYLLQTIARSWDEAERTGAVSQDDQVQIRLASTWAINQARIVCETIYHAAGSTAIFNNNPFERRFRDIHAGSQQGQGRTVHYETVGQILLGLEPEVGMFSR